VALRHQFSLVHRSHRPRLRLTSADRILWAWLSRVWRGWRPALHVVRPENGHRVAPARLSSVLDLEEPTPHRTSGCTEGGTRPDRELSSTNPLWGAPRIHGELQKLASR
jgi:putative transposase